MSLSSEVLCSTVQSQKMPFRGRTKLVHFLSPNKEYGSEMIEQSYVPATFFTQSAPSVLLGHIFML